MHQRSHGGNAAGKRAGQATVTVAPNEQPWHAVAYACRLGLGFARVRLAPYDSPAAAHLRASLLCIAACDAQHTAWGSCRYCWRSYSFMPCGKRWFYLPLWSHGLVFFCVHVCSVMIFEPLLTSPIADTIHSGCCLAIACGGWHCMRWISAAASRFGSAAVICVQSRLKCCRAVVGGAAHHQ